MVHFITHLIAHQSQLNDQASNIFNFIHKNARSFSAGSFLIIFLFTAGNLKLLSFNPDALPALLFQGTNNAQIINSQSFTSHLIIDKPNPQKYSK